MIRNTIQVFISYRRSQSAADAGRLHEALAKKYGRHAVFIDASKIEPGSAFPGRIREAIEAATVALVLIGREWVRAADATGARKLDDPGDWVATEVRLALAGRAHVIPVLLDGAEMPTAEELPEGLKPLAEIQASRLTSRYWSVDLERLCQAINSCRVGQRPSLRLALYAGAGALGLLAVFWGIDLFHRGPSCRLQRPIDRLLLEPIRLDNRICLISFVDEGDFAARRTKYADLLDLLVEKKAGVVAFDIYHEADVSEADEGFAQSIRGAELNETAVVMGASEVRPAFPEALKEVLKDRWGLIRLKALGCPDSPLPLIEVARLKYEYSRVEFRGCDDLFPSFGLRAFMRYKGVEECRYDGRTLFFTTDHGDELALAVEREWVEVAEDPPYVSMLFAPVRVGTATNLREVTRTEQEIASGLEDKLVILGSRKEEDLEEAFPARLGYQLNTFVISSLLSEAKVRRAGSRVALPAMALAAAAGVLWRRRKRRPLQISDPTSGYTHWASSLLDVALVGLVAGVVALAVAYVTVRAVGLLLPVPELIAAPAAGYLLLALSERRMAV